MVELSETMKEFYRKNGRSGVGIDFPFKCAWKECDKEMWYGECLHSIYNMKNQDFDYYCYEHYVMKREQMFFNLLNEWNGNTEPSKEFRKEFAYYVTSSYDCLPESLTEARVRDRTYRIRKVRYGIEFWITRHHNAWKRPEKMYEVNQHWKFCIKSRRLKLLESFD